MMASSDQLSNLLDALQGLHRGLRNSARNLAESIGDLMGCVQQGQVCILSSMESKINRRFPQETESNMHGIQALTEIVNYLRESVDDIISSSTSNIDIKYLEKYAH